MSFDAQPHLLGERLEVRPLAADDFAALCEVASDPLLWEQHPERDRWREHVFRRFFDAQLGSGGGLAVVDRADGRVIGTSRYHDYDPVASEVEIGWTFLARRHWGGETNGELKRLMLDHAFRFVDRVVFLVHPTNLRSRRAVEKLGAVEAGIRRTGVLYELRRP